MSSTFCYWKNLPIILTNHAYDKANEIQLTIWDIKQLLEYSEDCLENKRKKDTFERCSVWKGSNIKIVFKKDYTKWCECQSWIIITIIKGR